MSQSDARDGLNLPVCLIIMDGFGLAEPGPGNAISLANTPTLDHLFATCPTIKLQASGEAVGLPAGQMGNSEVGHLNIGAGRVVHQELSRINRACADGSLRANPVLMKAFRQVIDAGSVLHLMGLLSDGGVHSSNAHLYALMDMAAAMGVPRVHIHCFMDGRDVPPESGRGYIEGLQAKIDELNAGGAPSLPAEGGDGAAQPAATGADGAASGGPRFRIASVSGRMYAMDRDNRWEREQLAWEALVHANPLSDAPTAADAIQRSYDQGTTDEFVVPVALCDRGILDGDAVVFFNFRPDRAREISYAFTQPEFDRFDRGRTPRASFVCLTEYDPEIPAPVAFAKEFPANVLADVVSDAGLTQYHIAETEKYAHVTFFLNGGVEEPKAGERRVLIPSPKVATYDLQPQMSEPEVAETLACAIDGNEADVYIVNFANCDMVGHTGVIPAAVAAVEAVDAGVAQVLAALERAGGTALLTADHGNADRMIADDGTPFTAHTTALVPLCLIDYSGRGLGLKDGVGALCNISPTLLDIMGVAPSAEMDAESLLVRL